MVSSSQFKFCLPNLGSERIDIFTEWLRRGDAITVRLFYSNFTQQHW